MAVSRLDADVVRDQVRQLQHERDDLTRDIERLQAKVAALDGEIVKKNAQADRLESGTGVHVTVNHKALDKARRDPLLLAAGDAVDTLPIGFRSADLALKLGIQDKNRCVQMLLVLAEYERVERWGDGWAVVKADVRAVRDYMVEWKTGRVDVIAQTLSIHEDDVETILEELFQREMLKWISPVECEYVPVPNVRRNREQRQPPEATTSPAYSEAVFRGLPVRLVDRGKNAKMGSIPGQGHKMRLRNANFYTMEEAKAKRAEEARAKMTADMDKRKKKK